MINSVRRRRIFADLRRQGHRVKHGAVRLTYLDPAETDSTLESSPQVAYALGRKFGNAVERNRARRRLRDAFTQAWQAHENEADPSFRLRGAFLLSGHRGLLLAPFPTIVADINACFDRLQDRPAKTPTKDDQ